MTLCFLLSQNYSSHCKCNSTKVPKIPYDMYSTYIIFMDSQSNSFWYTGCFYSMTRFQQALKGTFFEISICDLLEIVGTEKGIFFHIWYMTIQEKLWKCERFEKSSESRKHLVLWKSYTYLQLWFFDLLLINCHKTVIKIVSLYQTQYNNSNEFLFCFHSWNQFYNCNFRFYGYWKSIRIFEKCWVFCSLFRTAKCLLFAEMTAFADVGVASLVDYRWSKVRCMTKCHECTKDLKEELSRYVWRVGCGWRLKFAEYSRTHCIFWLTSIKYVPY